jgi:hypothetical protein
MNNMKKNSRKKLRKLLRKLMMRTMMRTKIIRITLLMKVPSSRRAVETDSSREHPSSK